MKSAFDTLLYNNTGQHAIAFRSGKVWPLNGQEPLERPCRSFGAEDEARLSLEVTPEKVRCLVNGHLFYEAEGNPATSSPWLSLYAAAGRSATFRDVEIRGTPTIPRQLDLAADPRLSGWLPGVEGDTLPSWKLANEHTCDDDAHLDWSLAGEGEIRGRRLDASTAPGPVPGLLTYHRPIQSGETVRFEFLAEPGVVEAHPALGRLAFLLEPEGVRVRWISPHPEGDWTALEPDNAVAIPGARRGPDRLPIKSREWNHVALAILDDRMTIELNGALVYELPLAPGQSRRFGLYHDKARTSARARHIVLAGPWGDSLAAEVAGKLEAPRQGVAPPDAKTLDALLDRKPTPPDATVRVEAPKVEHWNLSTSGKTHELIYDRPIVGDFALSAELAIAPVPVELGYGGVRFGVSDDRKHYRWSNGERKGEGAFDPPLPGDKAWFKAELAIKGSEAAFSVDGRRVHAERLADRPDPWAVVSGLPASGESVRSLRVVGEPSVPRRVELSPLAGLRAWAIVPEPEPRGEHGPAYWAWHGEHLVGTPFYDIPESRQESRLVYRRPLLEDGEVSYEFFAEDASRMVHPSLGETGFLLAPDGIRAVDFPRPDHDDAPRESRLTDKPLAIRPNDWNQLRLALSGGKVTLRLNGEVILEQPWPSDAPRRFGLFHYLDETEAVVRRLAYEGAWPGASPKP
ncbi:DUF1583 domain-containing protein [Singulisphaera sp. PoT]|uniref:DUF1583 domain-containing protein n=1 Tax=Singulisphaera sp. PoT TaxID=3411797 RepID=UPI003BF50048